jgi:hypothetical protein
MPLPARSTRLLVAVAVLAAALGAGLLGAPTSLAGGPPDYSVTNGNNAGPGSYRAAINAIEQDAPSGLVFVQLDRGLHVQLANDVLYGHDADVYIQGGGSTIDGGGHQILVASEIVDIDFDNVTLEGASSDGDGGAVHVPQGSVDLSSSAVRDNHAGGDGGAVATTSFTGERSTFSGNQAGGAGGAVSGSFDATFVEATLAGNTAPSGAHVSTTELDVFASVFADGTGSPACAAILEDPTEDSNSYEEGGTSCDLSDPSSTESGADPQLAPLAGPTGATSTHVPAATSALVDAYAGPCESTHDQRDAERPQDGDGDGDAACDIGAAERREATFTDVQDGHPFFIEIEWMAESEISEGYQPGPTYRPSEPVSRQAMSAFLYRFAESPPFTDPAQATFGDVSPTNPFFTEVEWMAAEGISTGTPASPKPLYKPSDPVSRQAMSAFLYRFIDETFVPPSTATFTDVGTGHPFFLEIEWMADAGISEGYQPGPTYRPGTAVSRQAMSAFLYRVD